MTPILTLEHITAGYEQKTVLRDVNLTVYDHDFLGIIGPNGGGKTTLIKVILGLLHPLSGTRTFFRDGRPADSLKMGYLPQYNLIDKKFPISVEEVILSGLSGEKGLLRRFTAEHHARVKEVVARMGLEGLEHRAIGQLSGGQMQRALLGRAVISEPRIAQRNQPPLCHHPRQPRHRHHPPDGEEHRLRQRHTRLPPRHGSARGVD